MSRWDPISLRTGLVADIGREVTSSIRAVVNHAAVRGIDFLTRFLETRARLFAQRLRDVGNTE